MSAALRSHWPEYLIEAAGLALFMVSASLFALVLFHPASALAARLEDTWLRQALMGLAMGVTAVALIYSPWGMRSGAHFNPAVTLTFLRLGKVRPWDAAFYVLAQFTGGMVAMLLVARVLGRLVGDPSVNYVVTVPGPAGPRVAFAAELVISMVLMTTILRVSNAPRLAPLTGLCAGLLVAAYITVEAPLSGMSMNPARTFASAVPAGTWSAFWVYLLAPPLGMLAAAELHRRLQRPVHCAKLHHPSDGHCLFRCGYAAAKGAGG